MGLYDLEPNEVERQREILQPLRDRHREEILRSGLAMRALESTSLLNRSIPKRPITEGSYYHPSRRTFAWSPSWQVDELRGDTGLPQSGAFDMTVTPLDRALNSTTGPSFILYLNRYEPLHPEGKSPDYTSTVIGAQLSQHAQLLLQLDSPLLPVTGIKHDDLILMQHQLGELEQIRVEQNLDLLDPVTLAEIGEYRDF